MPQRNMYTEDECILALELYLRIPRKEITRSNPLIIELSEFLTEMGSPHSVGSIKAKVENFKTLDSTYAGAGLPNISKTDRMVWERYEEDGFTSLYDDAIKAMERISNGRAFEFTQIIPNYDPTIKGEVREYMTRVRINQDIFRTRVLRAYDSKCCITGVTKYELLRASHIKPWSASGPTPTERLDPCNGLCLNAFHDAAFDKGLFTLDEGLHIELSPALSSESEDVLEKWFFPYEGMKIAVPHSSFTPLEKYLEYHRKNIFKEREDGTA